MHEIDIYSFERTTYLYINGNDIKNPGSHNSHINRLNFFWHTAFAVAVYNCSLLE